ncbi:MAG: twin-arginine translocation signal domain-containing protein, partial [Planctomycetota bacterium]
MARPLPRDTLQVIIYPASFFGERAMTAKLSRRDFILVSAAAGAAGLAAGCVSNPAPTFEAAADR